MASGSTAFTLAFVPTGMKAGVRMSPWGVWIVPVRAHPLERTATSKPKLTGQGYRWRMPFTALILNPIHPGAATAARELGALGEVRTYPTTPDSPGPEQVAQALSEGAGSVAVAGGDGTQRLVAGALAGTGVPLGILATGTACVYSRNLGLPRGLAGAALAMTGVPRSLLGVRNNLKKRLGWVAYIRAGLGTMGRHRLPLRINGQPVEAWTVLAGNVGKVPTASLFPGARPDDGRLHVMHLGVDGWRDWWPVLLTGVTRSRRNIGKLLRWETAHVLIGSDIPRAVHLDGDLRTAARSLEVWIAPGTLQIRCPGERRLMPFR